MYLRFMASSRLTGAKFKLATEAFNLVGRGPVRLPASGGRQAGRDDKQTEAEQQQTTKWVASCGINHGAFCI